MLEGGSHLGRISLLDWCGLQPHGFRAFELFRKKGKESHHITNMLKIGKIPAPVFPFSKYPNPH
jgi:hypothetical protein